jgi:hypothetical protein
MLEPSLYLEIEGITKARVEHHCTQPNCIRKIKKGELYEHYRVNGLRLRCLVCITRHEIREHRRKADELDRWLEVNA